MRFSSPDDVEHFQSSVPAWSSKEPACLPACHYAVCELEALANLGTTLHYRCTWDVKRRKGVGSHLACKLVLLPTQNCFQRETVLPRLYV
jgi:hypothetical protein